MLKTQWFNCDLYSKFMSIFRAQEEPTINQHGQFIRIIFDLMWIRDSHYNNG